LFEPDHAAPAIHLRTQTQRAYYWQSTHFPTSLALHSATASAAIIPAIAAPSTIGPPVPHVFDSSPFDRVPVQRADDAWVRAQLEDPRGRYLALHDLTAAAAPGSRP